MPNDLILSAWNEFINQGHLAAVIPPIVANSWMRCRARINPLQKLYSAPVSSDYFLAAQVASFDLISIARPILEDIYQNIRHSDAAVVLLNSAGCLLDILAVPAMIERLEAQGIIRGGLCTEGHIGTNALGLALTERQPVQIVGAEHYCAQFHTLAGAAAPAFDITGRPLGVVGLLAPVESYETYSLALVMTGAKAIEAQRQADLLLVDYNNQLAQLNVILDTISEGIIVWNGERVMLHYNQFAAKMIDLPLEELVGKSVGSFLEFPEYIQRAIEQREPLTDVESNITIGAQRLNVVLSLRFVYNKGKLEWIIAIFRPVKEIRQLVQRQLGAQAMFTLDDIIGESTAIRRVRRQVASAAAASASILIRGEGGTGKNILASAIHNESPRHDGPFLIFPASSIPNELVLSELIGSEEISRGKRVGSRPSRFELAHGGTIYFQDVDALPLEAQSILLNVLELKVVQRLGSDRPVEVDVRVIASSSANMEKLIAEHRFRADLYYRLSTFKIHLPALRERSSDIPIFVERILQRLARQLGYPLSLGEGVLDALCRYPWPGNIRELEAVLGPASTQVGAAGVIELDCLPESLRHPYVVYDDVAGVEQVRPLDEVERETIQRLAQLWRGNLTQMAKALGIGRTTLWRKIKKYGILLEEEQV